MGGRSPGFLLSCAVLACIAFGAVSVWLALSQPWLGLKLKAEGEDVMAVSAAGPAAAIETPARVLEFGGRAVTPLDLTDEPDVLETWPVIHAFREGQDAFAQAMRQEAVVLTLSSDGARATEIAIEPEPFRPLGDLPAVFWVQLVVGTFALLIGAWVWVLKPQDWATRMFAISGVAIVLSTHSAAVYSTRELALPMSLFKPLSLINGLGAAGFGVAMICMFLVYPKPLVRPRWFALVAAASASLWSVWALEIAPIPTLSALHILTLMIGILVVLGVQILVTRKDPSARAVLLWLGLSVAIGSGAFVFSNAAPILLGFGGTMNQGYSFVFFLIIYAGLALGLRRYRLFEMGEWAFRILFYTGAAIAFLALDALLIWGLQLAPASALGIAMIAIAFLYLPLRDMLWRSTVGRRRIREDELFEAVVETAFATSSAERSDRWTRLVGRLFDPLEMMHQALGPAEPEASDDGLELVVPATADTPSLVLRYPFRGRGLFGPVHLKLARQLSGLMRQAEQSRDAFERGAAGERRRIARDLHDDVGARLLSGLHKADVDQTREVLRDAIADMRTIVGGLTGASLPLSKVVAELRHETGRRLEGAGMALEWPLSDAEADDTPLSYRVYKNWGSAHREVITNAIKHSKASTISVRLERDGEAIVATIADDGVGLPANPGGAGGNGLSNIRKRMAELGGTVANPEASSGYAVRLTVPLSPAPIPELEPSGIHA